jgi:hypothetical protein
MLLLFCIVEQLQTPIRLRQPELIEALGRDCYFDIKRLLDMLPGSSSDRFTTVFEFISHGGYLDFFLSSPDVELERVVVLNNLNNAMVPYQDDAKQITTFLKDGLQLRRRELSHLVSKPQLLHFLRRQETFSLFQEYLQVAKGENELFFLSLYTDVRSYMTITSRALLPSRASAIYEKYIAAESRCCLSIPESVKQKIRNDIDVEDFSTNLFGDVMAYTLHTLNQDFIAGFLESEQFGVLRKELDLIDMKMIAFFHEDPTAFMIQDEESEKVTIIDVKPSLLERVSFWN